MKAFDRRAASKSTVAAPPPLLAKPWSLHRITLVTTAALLPALGVSGYISALSFLPGFAVALAVAMGWTWIFALLRGHAPGWDWIATAAIFALIAPDTVPLWQQALALSFGVVMGEQVFGGRGRNFLHPAVVSLAFLMFSFPGDYQRPEDMGLAIAALAGALLLLGTGLVSWRVLVGIGLGAAASITVAGGGEDWRHLVSGSVLLGAVFLIADPVAAASTNAGRWIYGLLAGMLVVVFGHAGGDPGSIRAVVFAALMAGIFAPLIDQLVIWFNLRRKRRRG